MLDTLISIVFVGASLVVMVSMADSVLQLRHIFYVANTPQVDSITERPFPVPASRPIGTNVSRAAKALPNPMRDWRVAA